MSSVRGAASLPKQLVLIMQATAILLFAVCLQAGAASYSQTVSFTGKDVPLKTVFAAVKKQTGYGIFYANGEITTLEGTGTVTLDLKNVALDLFLQVCLRNKPLDYNIEGTTIFIKKKEARTFSEETTSGQPIALIKGRITNDNGEPLVNANIVVKSTGRGTITDANGNFILHNVNSDDQIAISFIGYKPQTVPIHDRTSFTLVMEPTTNELDKVVVQAYGTTSQRLATGSIGVVRAEDIEKQPVMNVLDAIQGQVPGLLITRQSGYSSGTTKVEIRGRNSLNSDFPSDPLYIIDGVPLTVLELGSISSYNNGSQGFVQGALVSPPGGLSPFFTINPKDIESVEVLKDADATAIYGSRGANGVILITTKKGKAGRTQCDIDVYNGVSEVPRYYNMLNTKQYISVRREALANDGLTPDINNAPDLTILDTTRYTDWQKKIWGALGKVTDVNINVGGGDARTAFRIGGEYRYQTDITTTTGENKRFSLSFNFSHKSLNQKFKVSLSGMYSYSTINMINMPNVVTLPPNAPPIFSKTGQLNYSEWDAAQLPFPFSNLLQPYTSASNFLNSNLFATYEVINGLNIGVSVGYNNVMTKQNQQEPIISQDPQYNNLGESDFGITFIHNLIFEPQIEYNKRISKGKINILLGSSAQNNATEGNTIIGLNYPNDFLLNSINNAPKRNATGVNGQYKYAAAFGRINFNWDDKYIINLNGRRDGSSRFGPGKQFGNFASVGGAWIFSEEQFIHDHLNFLSFGKLRASYGTTGSDQIGDYQYLSLWTSGALIPYNNIQPFSPIKHTDSLFQWQLNKKLELALGIGLFHDKLNLEISWYRNFCGNQLVYFPTPIFTGFNIVTANFPAKVENQGVEFQSTYKAFDNKDFKWAIRFNIAINRNKLLDYPNLANSPYKNSYVVGQPLNIAKLLHYTGVDPSTGLYTFTDKNKDGQVTIDNSNVTVDDRYIYNLNPKFDGGFSNTFSYKNIELSLFFYFRKQNGSNALGAAGIPGTIGNLPVGMLNRWQKPGDIVTTARYTTNPVDPSYTYYYYSDAIFTDASFIRLQNVSIGYNIPRSALNKLRIQSAKIYFRGDNIFFITSYKGVDPEIQNFGGMSIPRILTFGISCTL
jgi:TonB-linked SusC/RagA family outer membrane protein